MCAPVLRTFATLQTPDEAKDWDGDRTYLCDRCALPCPNRDIPCKTCNIVMHHGCLSSSEWDMYEEDRHEFVCGFCRDDKLVDKDFFEECRYELWEKEHEQANAQLIGKFF